MVTSRTKALKQQLLPQLIPIEPPSEIGFRVLVLDDQMFANELYPSLLILKDEGWGKYKRTISINPEVNLECIYNS